MAKVIVKRLDPILNPDATARATDLLQKVHRRALIKAMHGSLRSSSEKGPEAK